MGSREEQKSETYGRPRTSLSLPHHECFYDILTWMYSKDKKRLKNVAADIDNLLRLLHLGEELKMNEDFYGALLAGGEFALSIQHFESELWSRTAFTFPILLKVIEAMQLSNQEKLIALLSWMKEDFAKFPYSTAECSREREIELLTSLDFYTLHDYIKERQLMSGLDTAFLAELYKEFPSLVGLFDTETVFKEFALLGGAKVWCKICKKVFLSPVDAARSAECEKRLYHPRSFVASFRSLSEKQMPCLHSGCAKKLQRNEFPCCHQPSHSEGCTMGEGKHFLVVD